MNSFLRSTICAASPLVLDGWRIATGCAVGSADVLPRHLPAALVGQLPISEFENAGPLLVTGGAIWLTNVIVFGLWYWEFDRGGPVARPRHSSVSGLPVCADDQPGAGTAGLVTLCRSNTRLSA
jgi:hypothetical protein